MPRSPSSHGSSSSSDASDEEGLFDVKPNVKDVYHFAKGPDYIFIPIAVILALAGGFGMPVSMIYFGDLFDGVGNNNTDLVKTTVLVLFVIGCIVGFLMFAATVLIEVSVARQLEEMKKSFFQTILSLDMGYYDANSESLFTKLTSALLAFKSGAGHKLIISLMMMSMFIAGFIIGFVRSWELTCVLIAPIPLMGLAGYIWGKGMNETKAKEAARNAIANDVCEESVNSIKTVVAFGLEEEMSSRYDRKVDIITSQAIKGSIVGSLAMGLTLCLMFLTYALGFWYSGRMVRRDIKDPCCRYNAMPTDVQSEMDRCAELVKAAGGVVSPACEVISQMFIGIDSSIRADWFDVDYEAICPDITCFSGGRALSVFFSIIMGAMGLGQSGPMMNAFFRAAGSVTALKNLTSLPTPLSPFEFREDADPAEVGDIRFTDVGFRYPTRPDSVIFSKLNIKIEHGKTTALVGGSGCGKSTIVQLIDRYYCHGQGRITSNGVDIDRMNLSEWRDKIAIIPQEPRLFSLSIIENIRMGDRSATDVDCIRVAMQANAHEFIMEFPLGYHTYAGIGGGQLSGGQKQRICIARALLKNPEILILDEATSALDNKSERVVQATLDKILESSTRTTIVIAHRLSTIRNADAIIVLNPHKSEGSSMVERGNHKSLMGIQDGIYRELVDKQELEGLGRLDLSDVSVAIDINEDEVDRAARKMVKVFASKGKDDEKLTAKEAKKKEKAAEKAKAKAESQNGIGFGTLARDFLPGLTGMLSLGIIFSLLNGLTFPAYSIIFSYFISIFYSFDSEFITDESAKWALSFVVLAVAIFFTQAGQMYFFIGTSSNVQSRMRKRMFKAVLYQDMSYHDQPDNNAGTLTELLAKDIPHIAGLIADNLGVYTQALSTLVASMIIAFWANWRLAFAGLLGAFLNMLGGGLEFMVNGDTDFGGSSHTDDTEVGSGGFLFNETILNIKTISAFNLQDYMMGRFDWVCAKERKSDGVTAWVKGAASGLSQLFQFSSNAFVFWIASILMDNDLVGNSQEDLRKFNMAIFSLQMAGMGIAIAVMNGTDSARGKSGAIAVYNVLNRQPLIDVSDTKGDTTSLEKCETFELRDLCFSYPTRPSVPIYDGVNFSIPRGKTTALVGSSGSGKSTVIQLLLRLYDPAVPSFNDDENEATVSLSRSESVRVAPINSKSMNGIGENMQAVKERNYDDGPGAVLLHLRGNPIDLQMYQVESLRAQIALVSQEPVLFDDSILENVRFGLHSATDEDCIEALRSANAYDYVCEFDEGMETTVGKMGNKLSGGQKQRIAIARALVREPSVLLLDEATSALDSISEEIVQEALNKIMAQNRGNLTVVVVAHRLSTIRNADQIVVFEPSGTGSVVAEVGTHDELVAIDGGVYQGLCRATLE
eukprot:GHVH01004474.1.p1 GENE.GHVH01004474.1~~GHVH01004474.1.p1  ORF type:complete len:1396 (-),score=234.11 GHVH01004474.1:105-4292(-)